MAQNFDLFFARITEYNKHQGTIYRCQKSFLTIFVQMVRSFLWDLRGRQKQTFQKIDVFMVTKDFDPFFLAVLSFTNLKEPSLRVHKV